MKEKPIKKELEKNKHDEVFEEKLEEEDPELLDLYKQFEELFG